MKLRGILSRAKRLIWGQDLGRARLLLVYSILAVSLLGKTAVWAKPRIDNWLWPAPVPVVECSDLTIIFNANSSLSAARKWVKLPATTRITFYNFVWENSRKRTEFWMSDGPTIWELELVCFDTKRIHDPVFGEFFVEDFEDRYNTEIEIANREQGTK